MKILLGMSGGLDSTYAAKLLLDAGHTVEGAVLIMHEFTELSAARESAAALGIKLHEIDCTERFRDIVMKDFVEEYIAARTPNPCVICNSEIKFKCLCDYALEHGFDKIATGHYARVVYEDGRFAVARSADVSKDQTYMLWRLPQQILQYLVFPLGELTKNEVRKAAKDAELVAADREESQEICFIPSGDYAAFIEREQGVCPQGDFVDTDGNVLGRHSGIIRYTVGQRKGLGIALGARAFVTDINPVDNRITLSFEPKLTEKIRVEKVVFSGIVPPAPGIATEFFVKLRYLAPPVRASVVFDGNGVAEVFLATPVKSVTPGQSAVFYFGDKVAFGGIIHIN